MEIIGAIFGPLLKMVGFDYKNKRQKDAKLFELLMSELPPQSDSVLLLKDHDMGDSFLYELILPLNYAIEDWESADRVFQVKRLEKSKMDFIILLKGFLSEFAEHCEINENGYANIGVRDYEERPHVIDYCKNMNNLGTKAYEAYDKFVRLVRSEL